MQSARSWKEHKSLPKFATCAVWICRWHLTVSLHDSYGILWTGASGVWHTGLPCMSWCQSLVHIVSSKSDLVSDLSNETPQGWPVHNVVH